MRLLPAIGRVRIRQSQAIELPTRSATFKRTAVGHWFVTVVVKFAMPAAKVPIREEQAVGYDMVLEPPNFLVRSDGGAVRAPRHYRARERKLRRAQRQLSRARQGSRNRAKARRRVAHLQGLTANVRQEFLPGCSSNCHDVVGNSFADLSLKALARTKHYWNAAKNVRAEGLRIVAEGHSETGNACGLRVSLAEASIAG